MNTTYEYTSKTTFDDYWADKRDFKGCDAYYDSEETSMDGDDFYTTGITYKKKQSFWNDKETVWGTWVEEHTVRYEPITKVICSVRAGAGIWSQTVKEIGRIEYEDVEYFAYGKGFKHPTKSKYIHKVTTVMY